jgi:hypothetical protein
MSEEHHNTVKLDKLSKQFEEYNFFITQLNLLSNLAYDNTEVSNRVQRLFSSEACLSVLQVHCSRISISLPSGRFNAIADAQHILRFHDSGVY